MLCACNVFAVTKLPASNEDERFVHNVVCQKPFLCKYTVSHFVTRNALIEVL